MSSEEKPPQLLLRFFRWFCHPDYREDVEGDLLERFDKRVHNKGVMRARVQLAIDVLKLLRPEIVRPFGRGAGLNHFSMLKNHTKITLRYLLRQKAFTAINLVGLTTGILVAFFALLYVDFELSYDSYHEHGDRIYRLVTDIESPAGTQLESASIPMGPAVADNFPEVAGYARVFLDYMIVQSSPEIYMREDIAYADGSVFSVFTLPLVLHQTEKLLDSPYEAVLSETAAMKYFGTTACLGKQLTLDGGTHVYVTGVMHDMPVNSHFRTDIFLSLKLLTDVWNPVRKTSWSLFGAYTYLLLNDAPSLEEFEQRVTTFVNARIDKPATTYRMSLEPLSSLYLLAEPRGYRTGSSAAGDINSLVILVVVAVLVLAIAGFNFVNLSTALSLNRAKEISVRKVLGIGRSQLATHFMSDAILLAAVAFAMAAVLFVVLLPAFHEVAGKPVGTQAFANPGAIGALLGLTLVVGAIAGIYPAVFLSGFSPVYGLKGRLKLGGEGFSVRKALVTAQFFFSLVLIASTIGVYQQLQYLKNKDLGYAREQKLILDFYFDKNIISNEQLVKQEFLKIPGVKSVSMSSCVPGSTGRRFDTSVPGPDGAPSGFVAELYWIDVEFLRQYQIEVVAGRGFEEELRSDVGSAMILNESAVAALGYHDATEVIGKPFEQGGRWSGTVVGVVKDFHFRSLRSQIEPLTFQRNPVHFTFITVEVDAASPQATIAKLERRWAGFGPSRPFSYYFADQAYQAQYEADDRFGSLIFAFASVALLLSVLGLLGLSSLDMQRRAKEISIRKILGATSAGLVGLLSRDFMRLIVVAALPAIPVTAFALGSWLDGFAYRKAIEWWLFAVALGIVVVLSGLTIGSQVLKAALVNPVKYLKNE